MPDMHDVLGVSIRILSNLSK